MRIGVKIGPALGPELREAALEAERIGFDSVWLSERVVTPLDKPHPYEPMPDPWIALAVTFAAVAGSFLVSYTRARAEALGLRGDVGIGSRAERVVVITAGLVLAPLSIWLLVAAISLLSAAAWLTVLQRILAVRRQLRARG